MTKIGVLVVDESTAGRNFIAGLLATDPDLSVLGSATSGAEAVQAIDLLHPDVVLMDVATPFKDGLAAARTIMDRAPRPLILVTGQDDAQASANVFAGMEAGALAVLARPHGSRHPRHEAEVRDLLRTLKTMSEVKVVRRKANTSPLQVPSPATQPRPITTTLSERATTLKLVAVGASTGGPPVIRGIIAALPKDFSLPLLIVQHISPGFTNDFVNWLAGTTGYPVSVAVEGEILQPGRAYVAPEGAHTLVMPDLRVVLSHTPSEHGMRPAVSALFRSVTASLGSRAMGVLLTGMGQDGAAELAVMRAAGAVTIAQNAESSVVFGMPGEAIRLGGAGHICSADELPHLIVRLARTAKTEL